jgi:hypothetical protein
MAKKYKNSQTFDLILMLTFDIGSAVRRFSLMRMISKEIDTPEPKKKVNFAYELLLCLTLIIGWLNSSCNVLDRSYDRTNLFSLYGLQIISIILYTRYS